MAAPNNGKTGYNNESLHLKCLGVLINNWSNVSFIFEEENGIVKWPAHKEILAASSPVFDRMFFGDLREEGDVKIVDASSSAFKEFLQFFYVSQVNLTMENISEVLKLIDKYDVPDCYPICIRFLTENLTIDDILWGFNLSVTYKLTELKEHCTSVIQKNFQVIMDKLGEDADGNVKLTSNPPDRFLSEKDIQRIGLHLCKMSKTIFSYLSKQIETIPQICPFVFEEVSEMQQITECEIVRFHLTGEMLLTDIFCSKVYHEDSHGNIVTVVNLKFDISIENDESEVLFSSKIELIDGENHIQLKPLIRIEEDEPYAIIMRTPVLWEPHYTYSITRKENGEKPVLLAPDIRISFLNHYSPVRSRSNRSLISRLHFQTIEKN